MTAARNSSSFLPLATATLYYIPTVLLVVLLHTLPASHVKERKGGSVIRLVGRREKKRVMKGEILGGGGGGG